ncbi:MAG TPA: hypothetical protein VLA25_00355, partial [Methylotenera sp.]|nr:hypothetical protein [Methylotenera sp.]
MIKYNNGCSDVTCSFTVTVNDNQPPILQGTIPGGNVGNVCKSNAPVAPTEAAIAALYSDNCGTVTATFDNAMSGVTGDNCGWTATYTYLIKDGNNISAADAVVVYTGADNEKPTFTRPNDITIYTAANCSYDASVANTGDVTDEADNCSTGLNATYSDVKVDNCEGTYTITRKWSLTDNCGNAAADQYQTITVKDNTAPAFTRPADFTIPFTTTCTYDASLAATGDVTNEHDNCSTSLNATYSDVVSQCGYNTVITRTWSLVDNCGNAAANQVQTITVTDNNTPYIIYATKEAKFGEDNYINGDVGVADAKGKAEFKKGDVLNPYVVRAANINVQLPSMVSNKVFAPATGGPNPPFYAHVAALLSGNYDQAVNGVVPAGNYKNLKIKKGVTATITGSDYGKIEIEE